MRIEEGKYYRDEKGAKIGPMTPWEIGTDHTWQWEESNGSPDMDRLWKEDGTSDYNPWLVAEWVEPAAQWFLDVPASPIVTETVTVRRLEPGVYGPLHVGVQDNHGYPVLLSFAGKFTGKPISSGVGFNASELRELARVALEIAEYLDAQ